MSIRLRPLILYLGLTLGIVIASPTCVGCLWLLFNPEEILKDPAVMLIPLIVGPVLTFLVYRWCQIGASLTRDEVVLQGWFRTVRFPPSELAHVRETYRRSSQPGRSGGHYFALIDHDGHEIGEVPAMVTACQHWPQFLSRLRQLANLSRQQFNDNGPVDLLDKAVSEWTFEDIERYEAGDSG